MATTNSDLRAQLREVPEVTEVEETGRIIGNGAYCIVKELRVKGHRYAGKELHELFFFTECSREEQWSIIDRFAQECLRHSKLHHPNIVHFIGVNFRPGSQAPTLIMELMHCSLNQALQQNVLMPSPVKYRILLDVTYGLNFLHNQTPPIIHRDLTANNILLTEDMRAKIAGFGQAMILTRRRMSETPGNPAYMPPESFTDNPVYDTKLDMFSLGVLIIHTFIHDWPTPKELFQIDPADPGRTIALTEIERRAHYLERMGEGNPLKDMVTRCLQNDPALRPTAAEVIRELERIIRNDPLPFAKEELQSTFSEMDKPLSKSSAGTDPQSAPQIAKHCKGDKLKIWELAEVMKKTQGEWKQLAQCLHFENCEVAAIQQDNSTVMDMCRDMLGKWLEGHGERKPRTWDTLLLALREMDKTELADKLAAELK